MKSANANARFGAIALLGAAFGYAFFGPISRELGHTLPTFVQCFLRSALAIVLIVVVRPDSIRKLRTLTTRQWKIETMRAFLIGPIGTGAFVFAVNRTSLANIGLILATPWTVVWGALFFGERISVSGIAIVLLAAAGVALVGLQHQSSTMQFGIGEVAALVSVAGFSLGTMLRRLHRTEISDFDLVLPLLLLIEVFHATASVLHGEDFSLTSLTLHDLAISMVGGIIIVANTYLSNYGLQRTHGLIANNILATETIFTMLFGYLFYNERLMLNGQVGGALILVSVLLLPWISTEREGSESDEEPFTAEKL